MRELPLPKKEAVTLPVAGITFSWTVNFSIIGVLILLAVLPFFAPYGLAVEIVIFGLFALSYNILHGHMGQVSFGHAMFFGLGAYFSGLLSIFFPLPWWASWVWLVVGVAATGAVAMVVGTLVLKKRGAYFALTNLAFLQIFYFLILQIKGITGGDDGRWGVPIVFDLKGIPFYYFIFGVVAVCILIMRRIFTDSPFSLILHAIRENEDRVDFSGYDIFRYMLKAYTLSGIFAAIAGGLLAMHLSYMGLSMLHWSLAGEVIIMSMLGGVATFIGPMIGAIIFITVKDLIAANTGHWMLIMGLIVMAIILLMRDGILGKIKALRL